MAQTKKNNRQGRGRATRGWKKMSPVTHQRTIMLKKCGKKCFLGPNKSFPICKKNTCKIMPQGVYSAFIRARQYSSKGNKYKKIANKANTLIKKMKLRSA